MCDTQSYIQLTNEKISMYRQHKTFHYEARFSSQSCQLPVPVEKDFWIEMSWTLIDLM